MKSIMEPMTHRTAVKTYKAVEADLRAARHAGGVARERVIVPRGDHPREGLERGV